jgi:lysophospholipase L1-like esterase
VAPALCLAIFTACADDSASVAAKPRAAIPARMLALGDSYTSGEAVPATKSWPRQLAAALLADSVRVTALTVIAHTGWTTTDLIDTLAALTDTTRYDLVTLQIGVNNQFGRLPFSVFQNEFPLLVTRATALARDRPSRVVVLSIPDYSVTPVGSRVDPDRVRREIDGYNGFIAATLDSTRVTYINITDISRQAADDPTLIARDGLHPSGKMYALWVDVVRPAVAAILESR